MILSIFSCITVTVVEIIILRGKCDDSVLVSMLKFLNLANKSAELNNGPRQANLVLIAYESSEGSGEPAHPRSLARTFAARSYKQ